MQRHELELHRYQSQTSQSLFHLQELLKTHQKESERLRVENDLLNETLREQEKQSRRDVEEVELYAKQAQGNLERQLREFKA